MMTVASVLILMNVLAITTAMLMHLVITFLVPTTVHAATVTLVMVKHAMTLMSVPIHLRYVISMPHALI